MMDFDVRDLTFHGWILALLCCAGAAGVAAGAGLLAWSGLSHQQIQSGLAAIILGGGALGALGGLAIYRAGAAIAKARSVPLARPRKHPVVPPIYDFWFMATLLGLLGVVFGGVYLFVA